jgi:drug/metabolite transporter (DMT)-like permease
VTTAAARPSLVYGAILLQTVISAGTYLVAKSALGTLPWPALVMLRNLGSGVLFTLVLVLGKAPRLPPGKVLGRVLLLGLLGVPLNQALFIGGLSLTTPAHAALLYTLTPLFVLLVSLVARTEKLEGPKVAGIGLALAGAAVVVLARAKGGAMSGNLGGDLAVLAAVSAWATYTVLGRPIVREYGAVRATAWALLAGTLLFLPFGLPAAARVDFASLSASVWGSLLFIVTLTSFVSYLCWFYALEHLEPSRVAIFSNLQPVLTAGASWALFGEPITANLAGGGALVILGVVVATQLRAAVRPKVIAAVDDVGGGAG